MAEYDAVADVYDDHFTRPVDRWEDERLTRLLRPHVDARNVLDLGCGTGWVLDHLSPRHYVGIDASASMLARLQEKHPGTMVVKRRIGGRDWRPWVTDAFMEGLFETVVATWAAHDLPAPWNLLRDLDGLVRSGGRVILHGQGPRYERRPHYVMDGLDEAHRFKHFTVDALRGAATRAALIDGRPPRWRLEWVRGTGALPDRIAALPGTEWLWRACTVLPPEYHYAFAGCWRKIT